MQAQLGDEACSETIVIRDNETWKRVVRNLRYDGERYTPHTIRTFTMSEQDHGLFALRGASS